MCNESPSKLARKYPPYKNRIPPVTEGQSVLGLTCPYVLWSVLLLNKSALSLSAINCLCVQFSSLSVVTKNLLTCAHL